MNYFCSMFFTSDMATSIKTFLDLCRVSNLPTIWTNVLTAVVLSGAGFSWRSFLLLSLSMSLFYSGGMCLNDICDADIDRGKKPFRPIPSGKIPLKAARVFTGMVFTAALSLLLLFPYKEAVLAGIILLAAIIAYDMLNKTYPQSIILMAFCRLMVFAVSALAVAGGIGFLVVLAGSIQFIYTLSISVVARLENNRKVPYKFPVIPSMLSCISMLDGIVLALLASPVWLVAGVGGMVMTQMGQRYIKGD